MNKTDSLRLIMILLIVVTTIIILKSIKVSNEPYKGENCYKANDRQLCYNKQWWWNSPI